MRGLNVDSKIVGSSFVETAIWQPGQQQAVEPVLEFVPGVDSGGARSLC